MHYKTKNSKSKISMGDIRDYIETRIPRAKDREDYVLSCLLFGPDATEIIDKIDEECFSDGDNALIFSEAKEMFFLTQMINIQTLSQKLGKKPSEFRKKYHYYNSSNLESSITILIWTKVGRVIAHESLDLLTEAIDTKTVDDELLLKCLSFEDNVRNRVGPKMVSSVEKNRSFVDDWYVFPANPKKKFKVLPGKPGKSDYCIVDGRFVSETVMLRNGFQRLTLTDEEFPPPGTF